MQSSLNSNVHKEYNSATIDNDFAVIKLPVPVEFSRKYLYVLHTVYKSQHLESLALVMWYCYCIHLISVKDNIPGLFSLWTSLDIPAKPENVREFRGVKHMNCGAKKLTEQRYKNVLLIGCDTLFMVPCIDFCNESEV